MFLRVIDWPRAVAMVCDIAGGTMSVSLRRHARREGTSGGAAEVSGWDYHQVQPFGAGAARLPRLVETDHLRKTLLGVAASGGEFFAYELDGGSLYEAEAERLVMDFTDIRITVVALGVGDVSISWFLVSLPQNRDIIHWKMRYHERDQRPERPEPQAVG